MSPTHNNSAKASAISGNEIFEQARTLSVQGVDLLLKNFFAQLGQANFHHLSAKDSKRLIVQIDRKQEIIHSSFLLQIKNNFADFKALRKNRPNDPVSSDRQVLGLVGTNEYAETEELNSIISRFDKKYSKFYTSIAEQLASCIDRDQVEPHDNPMHVKHLCQSFQHSISSLNLIIAQKIALYKLFADTVIDRLEALYTSLEQCFIEHNPTPDLKPMPKKSTGQASKRQTEPSSSVAMSHIPVLMGVFQSFKDKSNNTHGEYGNLFPELKETLGQRKIGDFDHLIDQLSAIFEIVFSDEDLADRIKEQIGRLQIFIFMSEIQQSGFPVRSSHPARRLIETIIRTEVDFDIQSLSDRSGYEFLREEIDKISNNPFIESHTYAELCERYLDHTSDKSTSSATTDIGSEAKTEVSEEIAPAPVVTKVEVESEDAAAPEIIEVIELSEEAPVVASKKTENIYTVIQSMVNDMTLSLRVQGRSLILFDEVWSPLLLEVATTQGFKSQAWQKLLTIAKTQVWMLTPKTTQVELDKLMPVLAHVEKSLSQSMQSLSLPVDQQASLLEFLEHEQADVIAQSKTLIGEKEKPKKPKKKPVLEKPKTNNEDKGRRKNDQLADTIDEFSSLMETGRFNRSNDMLKALKSDKAPPKPETRLTSDNIHKGDWVEIKKGSTSILAKLTWKAADNSHYIFVDREGSRVCEISSEDLNKELNAGNISLISSTPVSSQRAAFSVIQTIR